MPFDRHDDQQRSFGRGGSIKRRNNVSGSLRRSNSHESNLDAYNTELEPNWSFQRNTQTTAPRNDSHSLSHHSTGAITFSSDQTSPHRGLYVSAGSVDYQNLRNYTAGVSVYSLHRAELENTPLEDATYSQPPTQYSTIQSNLTLQEQIVEPDEPPIYATVNKSSDVTTEGVAKTAAAGGNHGDEQDTS